MKHKKRSLLAVIAVLLVLAVYEWMSAGTSATEYRTDTITRGSISDVVSANGTLNPVELVNVGTQVSGQISQIYVKVNDHVTKGQLLAEIDPALLLTQIKQDQSSLETANSSFQQAQRDLNRTRMLLEKDYVAKVDLEHAEQAYLQAKNAYDAAKTVVERDQVNLGYARITAPIDGIIISQEVTMGQTLASNFQTPNMFKIAGDLSHMKIDVNLPESDIARVKEDMPVTFTVTAFPDRQFTGKVTTVNLSPNAQSGVVMYNVTVLADNSDSILLPGMTAYVSMIISEKKDVLRVSAAALRFTPPEKPESLINQLFPTGLPTTKTEEKATSDSKTIYLLKHGEPVAVQVKTGATDDAFVEISGTDIAEGEKVITGIKPPKNP